MRKNSNCVGVLLFILSFVFVTPLFAENFSLLTPDIYKDDQNLVMCGDKDFHVKFLCNPEWEIYTDDNAILVVVSSDPKVTVTISRYRTKFVFIEQIGKSTIAKIGHYSEGFRIDLVDFAKTRAIKVKAFAEESPQTRLLDYYFIKKNYLYNVLFAVNPKSEWENYKFLIKEISESFDFLKYSERTNLKQ